MPSLTVRIRNDDDAQAIEALKVTTHTTTAAKALLRAAPPAPR